MLPRDVESGEFEVGTDDANPIFNLSQNSFSRKNLFVEPQLQSSPSEPPLPPPRRRITTQQFERNVRARQSNSSVLPVPFSEAALALSASGLQPAHVSKKQWEKVGVEVSYPVTAEIFEKPEDDWLATASSRACARVEVNIKKLSSDERAQFRAAQGKEMDQWISSDVISVC